MNYHVNNISIVIKTKLSYHEVPMDQIITDYSDCLLLNRGTIEDINKKILKLGEYKVVHKFSDRINVLQKMANFKKNINYMYWENEYLTALERHMVEFYSDVHMMRATKSIQVNFEIKIEILKEIRK